MRQLIDRPDTSKIKNFDRLVVELSKYMTILELDSCLEFMETVSRSKYDINPTVDDSVTQLKMILGTERYLYLKGEWNKNNQHLLKNVGQKKFLHKPTGTFWDGLDATDDPTDYEEMYV